MSGSPSTIRSPGDLSHMRSWHSQRPSPPDQATELLQAMHRRGDACYQAWLANEDASLPHLLDATMSHLRSHVST